MCRGRHKRPDYFAYRLSGRSAVAWGVSIRLRPAPMVLHLGMDADTGQIVAVTLTNHAVDDASQVGPLLDQIHDSIASFTGDGAYDKEGVYAGVDERHPDASVVLPPRSTAVPSDTAETAPSQRDHHLQLIAETGRMGWQRASGYNRRARIEATIGRFKGVIGDGLRSRTDQRRATEVGVAVHASVLHGSANGRTEPYPCWELRDPDILRASEVQHTIPAMSCRVLGRLISNTSILRPWPSAPVSINRNTHAIYDAPAGSDPAGHTDLVPTPPISGHSPGRAASTRRRGERGHGAEPDAARRRGCRAAARGRDREAARGGA